MVINRSKYSGHVEFVDYTGEYPCLCMGILTLRIDGEEVKFGNSYKDSTVDHNTFWHSGGGITSDYCTYSGAWEIDYDELPEQYRQYADEIDYVFNANVPQGCCGGCI